MKMWIARTIGKKLRLFPEKPFYHEEFDMWYYWILNEGSSIDPSLFPEVTFENSPMEVELVIKK